MWPQASLTLRLCMNIDIVAPKLNPFTNAPSSLMRRLSVRTSRHGTNG